MDLDKITGMQSINSTMMSYLVNRGKLSQLEKDKILAMVSSPEYEIWQLGTIICNTKWNEYIACLAKDIKQK